jgi:nitroreductase
MEFSEVVRGRRSVRKYQNRAIPDSEVELLVDLARHAPSSMNGQPWHFVMVKDDKTKAALAEIKNRFCPPEKQAYQADFLLKAPLIMVVCVEKNRSFGREIENGILAASIIMLGAQSRGLGSVYMSAYISDEPKLSDAIRKELRIPEGLVPVSILPLGYPDEIPKPKEFRPLKEIIHVDQF